MIEPVYRDYFRHMYGSRYTVIECDIQFHSKKYPHCIVNVDGLLIDKKTGEFGILEIKHTGPRNINFIKDFQNGHTPEYWDVQERVYMEVLDADFACLFLGWGNRPGLDTNDMHRTERDKDFGSNLLEMAEDFMVNNVEAGLKPDIKAIKKKDLAKKAVAKLYGEQIATKTPVTFDEKLVPVLEALEEAKKKVEDLKKAESEIKKEKEKAIEQFEALSLPIREALKSSTRGVLVKGKKHYDVRFDVNNALDVEKVKQLYPEIYDECNKLAVDTAKLKKEHPSEYRECYGPKKGAERKFEFSSWESKK
jgi:hypothetical protein